MLRQKTSLPIRVNLLKTCLEFLGQYHLHPESKFDNDDFTDIGITQRKHILVSAIEHIGKEANHLEEQFYLGRDDDAQVVYGMSESDFQKLTDKTIREAKKYNRLQLAAAANYSVRELSRFLCGKVRPSRETVFQIQRAMEGLKTEDREKEAILSKAKIISEQIGLRAFAKLAGIDDGNLSYHLNRRRTPNHLSLGKIQIAFLKFDQA